MSRNRKDRFVAKHIEFETLVDKGVKIAKERGIKETDLDKIIHRHRGITIQSGCGS